MKMYKKVGLTCMLATALTTYSMDVEEGLGILSAMHSPPTEETPLGSEPPEQQEGEMSRSQKLCDPCWGTGCSVAPLCLSPIIAVLWCACGMACR